MSTNRINDLFSQDLNVINLGLEAVLRRIERRIALSR